MHAQANPHPYPMRYNPYRYNPLSRGQKIAIAAVSVVAVGTVTWLVWPKKAKADEPGLPPPGPGPGPGPSKRPPGHPAPFGSSCMPVGFGGTGAYDQGYWIGGDEGRAKILASFAELGYQTPANRDTMNELGPDTEIGGGDDVPNQEVRRFQREYNAVSRWGGFISGSQMGGLDADGLVGPCTLTGMKLVLDNLGGASWQDVVSQAKNDGFRP